MSSTSVKAPTHPPPSPLPLEILKNVGKKVQEMHRVQTKRQRPLERASICGGECHTLRMHPKLHIQQRTTCQATMRPEATTPFQDLREKAFALGAAPAAPVARPSMVLIGSVFLYLRQCICRLLYYRTTTTVQHVPCCVTPAIRHARCSLRILHPSKCRCVFLTSSSAWRH